MGLNCVGYPLWWCDIKNYTKRVRDHGITQFLRYFEFMTDKRSDVLKWGDEVEYIIVRFDHTKRKVRVSARADQILQEFSRKGDQFQFWRNEFAFSPEYGSFMLEAIPAVPYGGTLRGLISAEKNMRARRKAAKELLDEDEAILTIGNFPQLGCRDFMHPQRFTKTQIENSATMSSFIPDQAVSPYPRYQMVAKNIRQRRGRSFAMNVPIFKDYATNEKFSRELSCSSNSPGAKDNHIYMDTNAFGFCCCGLQVTIQAADLAEARCLHDQLIPITPIFLALSASTPIFKGYLADVDCRWNVLSGAGDDRNNVERGTKEDVTSFDSRVIGQSRCDMSSLYLHACSEKYNDIDIVCHWATYERLINNGIDPMLATYIAQLFLRSPIVLYSNRIEQELINLESLDLFENIQNTNWQSIRLKVPTVDDVSRGWRVEFRPTEVQLSDFENAAYVTFVVLLTRTLLSFGFTLVSPMSKVRKNMERAQVRDAVLNQKFYFRQNLVACPCRSPRQNQVNRAMCPGGTKSLHDKSDNCEDAQDQLLEMTAHDIMNGTNNFPGLIPLIYYYLDSVDVDVDTRCKLQQYLNLISRRASGKLMTTAHWIRSYVLKHGGYQHDSVVTDEICYDLLLKQVAIEEGLDFCPELLGDAATSGCF